MIIKSMSRHTPGFSKVLAYITGQAVVAGVPLLHNLTAADGDLGAVNRAFMANAEHCPSRKNGVVLYHEILSLAKADASSATPDMLLDLADRYLALRAPNAMAYGVVHLSENPHIHLVISGNQVGRARKSRISRAAFQRIKQDLETYQRERYPQLGHSIAQKSRARANQTLSEVHMKRRGSSTAKDAVRGAVEKAFFAALSFADYREQLASDAIIPYIRSGRHGVVCNHRKYRLSTLGLEQPFLDALQRWERLPRRLDALAGHRLDKDRRAFSDRIMRISDDRHRDHSLLHERRLEAAS